MDIPKLTPDEKLKKLKTDAMMDVRVFVWSVIWPSLQFIVSGADSNTYNSGRAQTRQKIAFKG